MGRPREFDVDEALKIAMELFWRKGYEGTSLSDLTEGMGITRPSLYGAFGNKKDLYGYVAALTDSCGPGGCMGINAALACSEAAAEVQRAVVEKRRRSEESLRERLAKTVAEGDLAADVDPVDLSRYVMTVAQGMAVQSSAGADHAALDRVVAITLKGLFA